MKSVVISRESEVSLSFIAARFSATREYKPDLALVPPDLE